MLRIIDFDKNYYQLRVGLKFGILTSFDQYQLAKAMHGVSGFSYNNMIEENGVFKISDEKIKKDEQTKVLRVKSNLITLTVGSGIRFNDYKKCKNDVIETLCRLPMGLRLDMISILDSLYEIEVPVKALKNNYELKLDNNYPTLSKLASSNNWTLDKYEIQYTGSSDFTTFVLQIRPSKQHDKDPHISFAFAFPKFEFPKRGKLSTSLMNVSNSRDKMFQEIHQQVIKSLLK